MNNRYVTIPNEEIILDLLSRYPNRMLTVKDIVEETLVLRPSVYSALFLLLEKGKVERIEDTSEKGYGKVWCWAVLGD